MLLKIKSDLLVNHLRSFKYNLSWDLYDIKRKIISQASQDKIINQKEIRVIGLRRTGNHAVINWISKQHQGVVYHLNNIPCRVNPYRNLYRHFPKERLYQESLGNFTIKDCLIYSYEDYDLPQIADDSFEKKHDLIYGKSQIRYDVLILRDPFNLIASRIKSNMMEVKETHKTFVDLWLAEAKEFLGETNYLKNNKVCVNYNLWFTDIEYRRTLADKLNVEFSDAGLDEVKVQGGGSSFDGRDFHGKATNMDVLNRWKNFADNALFLELIDNAELLKYSEKIFGKISGVEALPLRNLPQK